MPLRYSTGFRNHLAAGGSLKSAFQNGRLEIYTGTQPASPDSAATGTLLCTVTKDNGAHTPEVRATGTLLLAGAAGSINTVSVNGVSIIDAAVPFNTDLNTTAADLAAAINASQSVPDYTASANGATVTITAQLGMGASANGMVVAYTATTMTATASNMSGGADAVNGLRWGHSSAGAVSKLFSQIWEGTNVAGGTAGWYRLYGATADSGASDATGMTFREDGTIGTSGQQLNFSGSTVLSAGAKTTISGSSFTRTVPAA
jgi:hypothetical protein